MGSISSREIWIQFNNDEKVPPEALRAGDNGLFIGRKLIPDVGLAIVKYDETSQKAVTCHGNCVLDVQSFEILTGREHTWISACDDKIAECAVPGGLSFYGDPLYVGRTLIDGSFVPGAVNPALRAIQVEFKGHVVTKREYQVLVVIPTGIRNSADDNGDMLNKLMEQMENVLKVSRSFNVIKADYFLEEYPEDFDPDELGLKELTMAKSDDGQPECCICMDDKVDSVFYPCGHMSNCLKCARNEKARTGVCPICRKAVSDTVQVFKTF